MGSLRLAGTHPPTPLLVLVLVLVVVLERLV
jgi:hypothetical protein